MKQGWLACVLPLFCVLCHGEGHPAASQTIKDDDLRPGLEAAYFKLVGNVLDIPDLLSLKPFLLRTENQIDHENIDGAWEGVGQWNNFAAQWRGYIKIPSENKIRYTLWTEDGARLYIDGKLIVDNGGQHGMQEKDGEAELSKGFHEIRIDFFNNGGDPGCIFYWRLSGRFREVVPATVLFHKKPPDEDSSSIEAED